MILIPQPVPTPQFKALDPLVQYPMVEDTHRGNEQGTLTLVRVVNLGRGRLGAPWGGFWLEAPEAIPGVADNLGRWGQ